MDLTSLFINWDQLAAIGSLPPDELMLYVFTHGMGFVYVFVIVLMAYDLWLNAKQVNWFMKKKFIFLAIDIPRDSEQTPKAVEQLFATLSGAQATPSKKEKYEGQFQLGFSFELISIDGYVQFLIRTPDYWRDLVESAVYSQYPDAEITEVSDYTTDIPVHFPNDDYNMWGTEVVPVAPDYLPIRTYTEFEDKVSGEFKDPMASIIETMSKIRNGEQVWLQLLVRPTMGNDWAKKANAAAMKLAGKKGPAPKKPWYENILAPIFGLFFLSNGEPMVWWTDAEASKSKKEVKKDDAPSQMLHLTPGEKGKLEAIERKASKILFECKIRLIYLSPHDQYNPGRVIAPVFGSLKQFSTMDLNAFKPDGKTKTKAEWFFVKYKMSQRRQNLIKAYKSRSNRAGHEHFMLNTEELATLWHFPSMEISTPMLQKTESKKSEPPASLPIFTEVKASANFENELRKQLRTNLPANASLDNKYFENKFSKNSDSDVDDKKAAAPRNLPVK
jgi:hypothetical protein